MRDRPAALLAKAIFPTKVLWFAFVGAAVIYGIVVWLAAESPTRPFVDRGPLTGDLVFIGLVLVAVVALVIGRSLAGFAVTRDRLRAVVAIDIVIALARNGNLEPEEIEAIKALPESEQRLFRFIPPWQTAVVLECASYECVALCGLIISYLRHDGALFLPFGAVSIVALLMTKPQLDGLMDLSRSVP